MMPKTWKGFAVAVACKLHHIPLTIIRGMSNIAGVRDKAEWMIDEALDAAVSMANDFLHR
ncbi:MAG: hypothetical protein R3C05_14990 [Pirellulaceae bacterium]